jgi:hypothetical protein
VGCLVKQDVNGRPERDLSSPFSRVHILKVQLVTVTGKRYLIDRRRGTETDDGRIEPKQQAEGMEKATPLDIEDYDYA